MLSFASSHAGRRSSSMRSLVESTSTKICRWSSSTSTPISTSQRGHLRTALNVKPGDKIGGFDVVSVEPLPDFDATLIHSIHRATGCEYVHTDCPDTNNVFGTTFRTLPEDDSGTPHILEHTVLCGSKQYPVRDPFFRMMKRSLNTFMNAMTAGEYTMYPFSTQNEQDFENLANVYMDLLFFPNLRKNDFMQEGHRLELNSVDSEASDVAKEELVRSGVVYNEMKGTLSDSSTLYGYTLNQRLVPGTMSSAGLPHAIPELTHEKLVDFHKRHYHPSNALFFTYGDMPFERHIERMERVVLSKFEHSPESASSMQKYNEVRAGVNAYANSTPNVSLIDREQWPDRVEITGPCDPVGDTSKQHKYSISFLLKHEITDPYIGLVLGVLDNLLASGPGAPLYDRLIQSRLATAYCPSSGMSLHGFGHSYTIGGDGVAGDDASLVAIEDAIIDGLQDVANNGFEEKRVAAVLHQLELSLLYKSPSRGLSVMQGVSAMWSQHGCKDLAPALRSSSLVDRLRHDVTSDPQFFQRVVKEQLLARPCTIRLLMRPDTEFVDKESEQEKEKLTVIHEKLTDSDKSEIRAKSAELAVERDAEPDLSCLPTLTIDGLSRSPPDQANQTHRFIAQPTGTAATNTNTKQGNVGLSWVGDQNTNGIVYVRGAIDTSHVPMELKPYLRLLGGLMGGVGTKQRDHKEFTAEANLLVGALGVSASTGIWMKPNEHSLGNGAVPITGIQENVNGFLPYREGMNFSLTCLQRNWEPAMDLMEEMVHESVFDQDIDHLEGRINQIASAKARSLNESPESYAGMLASVTHGGMERTINEVQGGLTYVDLIQGIQSQGQDGARGLASTLKDLAHLVFVEGSTPHFGVVAGGQSLDDAAQQAIEKRLIGFGGTFGGSPIGGNKSLETLSQEVPTQMNRMHLENQSVGGHFFGLPIGIHYCATSMPTGITSDPRRRALLHVLTELCSLTLHREIREKGGAYGSWCHMDLSGMLAMGSYYDPNTTETLRAFGLGLQGLCAGNFTDEQVRESVLSIFARLDAPNEVPTRGGSEFHYGYTREDQQLIRNEFFNVDRESLVKLAKETFGHIDKESFVEMVDVNGKPLKASVSVFGNKASGEQSCFSESDRWSVGGASAAK